MPERQPEKQTVYQSPKVLKKTKLNSPYSDTQMNEHICNSRTHRPRIDDEVGIAHVNVVSSKGPDDTREKPVKETSRTNLPLVSNSQSLGAVCLSTNTSLSRIISICISNNHAVGNKAVWNYWSKIKCCDQHFDNLECK